MLFDKNKSQLDRYVQLVNVLIRQKHLIVFIGSTGVMLCAIRGNAVLDTLFIEQNKQHNIENYADFFRAYKHYSITFLVDTTETILLHENVSMLQGVSKQEHVEKLVFTQDNNTEIVAYNIYNLSEDTKEHIEVCIAKYRYTAPQNTILEYLLTNSYRYSGTYFLLLEFEGIIDMLLQKVNIVVNPNNLQIFATVTRTSGVRICVKHKKNIVDHAMVDYPYKESTEYVFGTVRQAINDKLRLTKNYVISLELKIDIIILVNEELKKLFEQFDFSGHQKTVLSWSDTGLNTEDSASKETMFFDRIIVGLFNRTRKHIAYSTQLKSLTKVHLLSAAIFKPFLALAAWFAALILSTEYQMYSTSKDTNNLNQEYRILSMEYKNMKNQRPGIAQGAASAELAFIKELLSKPKPNPTEELQNLFAINTAKMIIQQANWEVDDYLNLNKTEHNIVLKIVLEYRDAISKIKEAPMAINNYITHVKTILPDYEIQLNVLDDRQRKFANEFTIPVNITLTKTFN